VLGDAVLGDAVLGDGGYPNPRADAESLDRQGRSLCMRLAIPLLLFVAACGPALPVGLTDRVSPDAIEISISLYVVHSDSNPASPLSSQRSVDELEGIFARMQPIWEQAGIDLTAETAATITVPDAVLSDLAARDTTSFFDAASRGTISIPEPGAVLGFYVAAIGTANGLTPVGSRVFFVADEPAVRDERVSSHEIGHIFGLSHTRSDKARLMFSGTNGTDLTSEEAAVARYGAQAVLDGVR